MCFLWLVDWWDGVSLTVKMQAYLEPCLQWQKTTIISGEFSNQGIYLDLSSWLAYIFFQKRKMVHCKLSIFIVSFELLSATKDFFPFLNITLNQSINGTWRPESPLPRSTRFFKYIIAFWLMSCWCILSDRMGLKPQKRKIHGVACFNLELWHFDLIEDYKHIELVNDAWLLYPCCFVENVGWFSLSVFSWLFLSPLELMKIEVVG